MYIGAWTEFRLAQQEQARNSRRQDAAQPTESRARKGAGIYHPSLSNKGGMEVAGLPDRESFRRTLETALSSNLAADDAENISQALEPLMQRLPSIQPAVPASRRRPGGRAPASMSRSAKLPCRQLKRNTLSRRCGGSPSRYIYTRSDAGTRPAAEPTSDGTRSTRSTGGLEEHTARSMRLHDGRRSDEFGFGRPYRQGRPGGRNRTSHLPLIIDARRRRQNSHDSDATYSGNIHIINDTLRSPRGASISIEANETGEGGDEDNSCRTPSPTRVTEVISHNEEEVAPVRGGYDGRAAATMLRIARRRDPVGLKADFEQFWTWKRKAPTPTIANGRKGTPSATKRCVSNKREAGGGGRADSATSKLEALERMKMVYMAKEIDDGGCNPAAITADPPRERHPTTIQSPGSRRSDNVTCAPHGEVAQTTHSSEELGGGANLKLSRNADDKTDDSMAQQNHGRGGGRSGSDEATAKPGAHDGGSNFDELESGAAVDVPDLELTESQIQQVEKYFGGSGSGGGGVGLWRRRPPEEGITRYSAASEPAESLGRENPSAREAAGNVGKDRDVYCGGGGDGGHKNSARNFGHGDRKGEKEASKVDDIVVGPGTPRRRQDLEAESFSPSGVTAAAAAAAAGAKSAEAANLRDERAFATGGFDRSGQQDGVSFQKSTERGPIEQLPSEGKAPFSFPGDAEKAPSPNAVAPAWCCGDTSSLEDLVCWTKGLDYDAAVKGL